MEKFLYNEVTSPLTNDLLCVYGCLDQNRFTRTKWNSQFWKTVGLNKWLLVRLLSLEGSLSMRWFGLFFAVVCKIEV